MTNEPKHPKTFPAEPTQRKDEAAPRKIKANTPGNEALMQEAADYVLREHADVLEDLSKR